jgi:hypothetical protein
MIFSAATDLMSREVAGMRQASTRSTGLEPGSSADESFNFLLQHFGWQNRDVPPRMLVGIRASLRAVLDLTKPANILPHPELEELLREDWRRRNSEKKESRSQALGRAVADLAEGILAPSRLRTGKN